MEFILFLFKSMIIIIAIIFLNINLPSLMFANIHNPGDSFPQ